MKRLIENVDVADINSVICDYNRELHNSSLKIEWASLKGIFDGISLILRRINAHLNFLYNEVYGKFRGKTTFTEPTIDTSSTDYSPPIIPKVNVLRPLEKTPINVMIRLAFSVISSVSSMLSSTYENAVKESDSYYSSDITETINDSLESDRLIVDKEKELTEKAGLTTAEVKGIEQEAEENAENATSTADEEFIEEVVETIGNDGSYNPFAPIAVPSLPKNNGEMREWLINQLNERAEGKQSERAAKASEIAQKTQEVKEKGAIAAAARTDAAKAEEEAQKAADILAAWTQHVSDVRSGRETEPIEHSTATYTNSNGETVVVTVDGNGLYTTTYHADGTTTQTSDYVARNGSGTFATHTTEVSHKDGSSTETKETASKFDNFAGLIMGTKTETTVTEYDKNGNETNTSSSTGRIGSGSSTDGIGQITDQGIEIAQTASSGASTAAGHAEDRANEAEDDYNSSSDDLDDAINDYNNSNDDNSSGSGYDNLTDEQIQELIDELNDGADVEDVWNHADEMVNENNNNEGEP